MCSVVRDVMRLQSLGHLLEPILEPLVRKVVRISPVIILWISCFYLYSGIPFSFLFMLFHGDVICLLILGVS